MPSNTMINTVVGACYRILRPLGEGGMGTVYEAQHLRLGGKVAIKILSEQFATNPKFRDRFKREAKAASQIRHPNVVQITDFGETPQGSVFFAMEILEGRDLHAILRGHAPEPFPVRRARHLLGQAADALAAAHRSGVVHRDVKPSNIFVLEGPGVDDFVKLLDFGIAKVLAPKPTADSALVKNLTGTGEIFGTAKYMAPEQAYGSSDDPRVDVYSLGVVAYELLTGQVPFSGQSNFEIITRHVYGVPRPLRELRRDLPASLEAIVLRAMAKKAEDRFATMEDFGGALRKERDTLVLGMPGTPAPVPRTHPDTGASTLPRQTHMDRPPIEPTMYQRPVEATSVALPPPVREPTPTVLTPSQPQEGMGPLPGPGAHSASDAGPTQQMSDLGHAQVPTGPFGRPRGSGYDDTGRDLVVGPPAESAGSKPILAVALGVFAVGTLSAAGAYFATRSDPVAGDSTSAQVPVSSPREPMLDEGKPPIQPEISEPLAPSSTGDVLLDDDHGATVDMSSTTELGPSVPGAADQSDAPIDAPLDHDVEQLSKPSPSSTRPRKSDEELLKDLMARVKASCHSPKEMYIFINLEVNARGRVTKVNTDAEEALAACVERSAKKLRFSRERSLTIKRVLIKPRGGFNPFAPSRE